MSKDIILDHKDIGDSQTITRVTEDAFKREGLDCHRHEVTDMYDDNDKGIRKLTVQTPRLFFSVPELPWHKKR
jgi:hypothetical protein